ncbi:micrococcal nuclease-like nuclease [Thiorhodovibrio frisius]|uniref:Micrococcal nuclease-like nuclease n=2 Tax=Thiorhodovibrio frisius TaxID=631362 RepID=H8Z3Y8_9GAMM|nr:micrococcal nuclease-like nuclease [Thiorhodovibrio frisius]WPL22200.1 nuclease [Thiorhodovibrio frisius]
MPMPQCLSVIANLEITPATLSLVAKDRDRYGRIVGEVFDGPTSINLAMVEAGKAAVYPDYCKNPRYYATERSARAGHQSHQPWSDRTLISPPWKQRRIPAQV